MMFREALKVSAYDLGGARDIYRSERGADACEGGRDLGGRSKLHPPCCCCRFATAGAEGMHRGLIQRFIEVQAQLLAPITPHTSEHIWGNILGKKVTQ